MSDGFGLAFESELIIDENNGDTNWWTAFPNHTVVEIENILEEFMGIQTLVTITLPFDGIHHIDMHMKLLDESTYLSLNIRMDYQMALKSMQILITFYQILVLNGVHLLMVNIPSPPSTSGAFPGSQPELGNRLMAITEPIQMQFL